MTRILVVYHSQAGHTARLARAAADGAAEVENVTVRLKKAKDAGMDDLLACSGLIIASPEYFGYMAGMIKDFFDRTYEPARTFPEMVNKAYALLVSAGNDGRNTVEQIRRICTGYPLKQVCEPVIARGEVTKDHLDACAQLGRTIAAGCDLGIW